MNPDILKPKEENLISLATEIGLAVFPSDTVEKSEGEKPTQKTDPRTPKPYSQLT